MPKTVATCMMFVEGSARICTEKEYDRVEPQARVSGRPPTM